MIKQAIKWIGGVNGFLEAIDQRKLPQRLVKVKIRDTKSLVAAIKTLAVRGAPLIGVAGAYGLVLAIQKINKKSSLQMHLMLLKKEAEESHNRGPPQSIFRGRSIVCCRKQ